MFCPNCGERILDGSNFCNHCGAAIDGAAVETAPDAAPDAPRLVQDPSLPEGIFRDEDGAYHWVYHMSMWKNPVPLLTLIKLSFGICAGLGLLIGIVGIAKYGDYQEALKEFAIVFFGIGGFFVVLSLIAWAILSAARGGGYVVEHLMTEDQVVYLQTPEEQERTKKTGKAVFVLGLLSGDLTTTGLGAATAGSESWTSDYRDVKAVIAARRHDLIKVNNVLQRNTIYAYPHQYDFVWNYITSHCPGAKIKG